MSADEMERSLEAGFASELVDGLKGGIETRLSKRFPEGVDLSGGQWQRLAIARAHANADASILILDDPTAAMDAEAEAAFMARPMAPGRSLILISHRLSNLRTADRIILLKKGQVVGSGTLESQANLGEVYADMFDVQAEPYR